MLPTNTKGPSPNLNALWRKKNGARTRHCIGRDKGMGNDREKLLNRIRFRKELGRSLQKQAEKALPPGEILFQTRDNHRRNQRGGFLH
jgi:hypothetical protein